jgi:sulfite exporter TauE/SafE/copper chaperone CopZ
MSREFTSKVFQVGGMSCSSCEMKIEKGLRKLDGVKEVKASLAKSQVNVEYDSSVIEPETLMATIKKMGYEVEASDKPAPKKGSVNQLIGMGIIIFALYFIIKSTVGFNFIPQVDKSVGYGMLFVIGLLTSLHCIAMCGGINLSQCVTYQAVEGESRFTKFKPSLLYNTGRIISYTIIGGIVGAIGSVVSFSGSAKGIVAIAGGVFMVIIGINMLDIFPWLRKIKISTPKFFGDKIYDNTSKRGPFYVGLLNGLMPCGPLQTMQLYALGTGSFLAGATAMFLFSLGTVPLMFGFGAVSSFLSNKFTRRMLKVSAVLVIVLGLTMINRGLSLSGISIAAAPIPGGAGSIAQIQGGVQVVTTTMESGQYQPFVVQKGIPVHWIIKAQAEDLNGCNNPVTIPQYDIQKKLVPGDNIIEFTPDQEGTVAYTCWMGMIRSYIKVVPDISKVSKTDLDQNNPQASGGSGGGCCAAGAQATRFRDGRVPTDDIQVARVVNGIQEIDIKVNDQGYSPAAIVVQRGIKAKIKFIGEKLNYCNYVVVFPEYQGQLDLSQGQTETPEINITQDFTFQCGMGMLHGYAKVVDDIRNIDLNAIKKEIGAYRAAGGGSCCGR